MTLAQTAATLLACVLLTTPAPAQPATQPQPPNPTPSSTTPQSDPFQAPGSEALGERVALGKLAMVFLEREYKQHPDNIPAILDEVHKTIEADCADDPVARASGRLALCTFLLQSAPDYGIQDFESIIAAPGAATENSLAVARLLAAMVYMRDAHPIPAARQLNAIVNNASLPDSVMLVALFFRAMAAEDPRLGKEDLQRARSLTATLGSDELFTCLTMAELKWAQNEKEVEDVANKLEQNAQHASNPRISAMMVLFAAQVSKKDATTQTPTIRAAAAKMRSAPIVDLDQHFNELIWLVSATHEKWPDLAGEIADEAEAFARAKFAKDSTEVRLARLIRAKTLKAAGQTELLLPYADLDLSILVDSNLRGTIEIDGNIPTLKIECTAKERTAGADK